MINAFEAANLTENYATISKLKSQIERTIMEHIESGSTIRFVSLCCDDEDDEVIDTYIIPWLENLRYTVRRNSGDAGHDGPYNNLVIRW